MLKSHEKFHSANGKRQILIVDDEQVNRELLGAILQDEYEILYAEDGRQALDMVRENSQTLSLVLLDILMPVMNGMEVLKAIKKDPQIWNIPVIVITSDRQAEVESLSFGASDFIPKPYPQVEVIRARVLKTIELSEDRQIINSTERDPLTGLYNREYFYRYAEQFDQHHRDMSMDAIVLDVDHFHMINERFGAEYGDDVLRRIGEKIREIVGETGGIVCRREADTFLVYCPHGQDYDAIVENASIGIAGDDTAGGRIRLRMGVYAEVDKNYEIERRFDRAKMAADKVKGNYARNIGIYDSDLHNKELFAEQLIEDFHKAINEKQFRVFYQPKFDVRAEIPILASAEALVRWQHPTLGMISPGLFIPLFEDNGLIQDLDHYVWREAAEQVKDWKERFDVTVPVSVNVSRIDMYDPALKEVLQDILEKSGLTTGEFLLEITESAYTQDSEQIISVVEDLRKLGFRIEMDDFGTGYSSLNMISTLPIDALKLDMQFIRNAFDKKKDTRMLEVIIDIADYLDVPVIAEGVETEEQLNALKAMGCDMVQGFYFSKPLPPEEYEYYVQERKKLGDVTVIEGRDGGRTSDGRHDPGFGKIAHALSSGFESIYYVDTENDHYVEFNSHGKHEDLQIERSGANFFEETRSNIERVVYEEDKERVALSMEKDALLTQLAGPNPFSITYRLMIEGEPVYYNLKVVRANTTDGHHIVIGVSNVDEQMRQMDAFEAPNPVNFNSLAKALTHDMQSIYYVDINTDTYKEFRASGSDGMLSLELNGEDFFGECRENIKKYIYKDDQEKVGAALEKHTLLASIEDKGAFYLIYRMISGGRPIYYRLKCVHAEGMDKQHIIIGVSNIEEQLTEEEKAEIQKRNSVTFSRIAQALSRDFFSIYYVDVETDHFIEYSSHEEYQQLDIEKAGDDFFGMSRKNIQRVVHPDDLEMFMDVFTKDNIMAELKKNRTFTLTYRLMFDGVPTYVHMKAMRMEDETVPHIVIGVSNIDEQIRRESDHNRALKLAQQDALTGVKSKNAYVEMESDVDQAIAKDKAGEFAVVVCDVNGLKEVNDTRGHKAGDQLLKDACSRICTVFKHSPVYRVGGDEFVAVLRSKDYETREELMKKMAAHNEEGDIIVASGMSEFIKGSDKNIASVFERADARMYDDKKALKAGR